MANLLTRMQTTEVNKAEMPKVIKLKEECDTLKNVVDDAAAKWKLDKKNPAAPLGDTGGDEDDNQGGRVEAKGGKKVKGGKGKKGKEKSGKGVIKKEK